MEFRCRLGTSAGQVIEGVYIAPSEAHLRRELEEKGLHVLSLAARGGVKGITIGAAEDSPRRVPDLQPGAGDPAQGRHAARAVARHPAPAAQQSGVQGRARRRAREGARRHGAVRRLHRPRRPLSRRLHGVARRRRAQRLARRACCAASSPTRRSSTRSGRRRSRRMLYPAILTVAGGRCWSASSWSRSCRRSRASTRASIRNCRSSPASSSASPTSCAATCCCSSSPSAAPWRRSSPG